jgi:hypothetical protein
VICKHLHNKKQTILHSTGEETVSAVKALSKDIKHVSSRIIIGTQMSLTSGPSLPLPTPPPDLKWLSDSSRNHHSPCSGKVM